MSTVISRRVAATPLRTSSEVWELMCQLLAPDSASLARGVLDRATGVACSSIASEVLKGDAVVVYGSGPRIRLYCLYDEDAMAGEDASEGSLPECPTTGDWRMSIPVPEEDFDWCAKAIKACAPYITVRRCGEEVADDEASGQSERATVRINLEEFFKS